MNKLLFTLVFASIISGTEILCQEHANKTEETTVVVENSDIKTYKKPAALSKKTKKALIATACLALAGGSAAYFLPLKEYFETLVQKVGLKDASTKDATTTENVKTTKRIRIFFNKQAKKAKDFFSSEKPVEA